MKLDDYRLGYHPAEGKKQMRYAGKLVALVSIALVSGSPMVLVVYPQLGLYTALFAPASLTQHLVARLHAETIQAFEQPRMKEVLAANSAEGGRQTPAQLTDLLAREVRDWGEIIRSTGVRIE
jgi:hypothetical protein